MATDSVPNFIIVDDDVTNNIICTRIIQIVYPDADIQTFTDPEEGLAYLQSDYVQQHAADTVLFLDINMPKVNGWDFLKSFEQFDSTIKEQMKIYMLSSSINPMDKIRAGSNKNVWDYIEKPLTQEAVEETVAKIREEERAALSREIHDELGQKLVRLKMDIVWLSSKIPSPDDAITERIKASVALVDETVQTIRRINQELRPRILDDLGLFAAIESHITEFNRQNEISCKLKIEMEEPEVSKLLSSNIFRICQEALANVNRHSKATQVKVTIYYEQNDLCMRIEDNGVGLGKNDTAKSRSFGIIGMKERAALIRGDIQILSKPGKGVTIELRVPLIISK